jgi:hypothetical protein
MLIGACGKSRETAQDAPGAGILAPAPDPARKQVEEIVREVRAVLPGLPSQGVEPPRWPEVPDSGSPPRLALIGEGRLILAAGAEGLPGAIGVELSLDERDPPGGYLSVRAGGMPERWPILSSSGTGSRGGDFAYLFRITDPENRLRYLALLGVRYGTGALRFRSFEGYLIFPGKGGTLADRPPLYPIDFGYHWPLPPRHEARLDMLRQESEALAGRLEELTRLKARAAEAGQVEEALRASPVPPAQEPRRQAELLALTGRRTEAEQAHAQLAEAVAAALERLYRLRGEIAGDWEAFRASNPYLWMSEAERRKSFAGLEQAAAWRATWRQGFEAVRGAERPALLAAREAMERALLRELERKP